ncbi:MAG TPA: HAD-IB family hydrolase [Candidatus Nanoarchaeia archaeon]|nr:HAD-IB family hydrolase [Candidatus Nanoarchaeia archaeon]
MAVALFDVDDTIVDGACAIIYAKYLYKKKALNLSFLVKVHLYLLYYMLLARLNRLNIKKIEEKWFKELSSKISVDEALHLGRQCFEEEIKPKIYREVLPIIKKHAERGDRIVLISNSPKFLIEQLANHLNIKEFYGTDFVCENNRFKSIKQPYCFGEGKAKIIKKSSLDLKNSYAYSDSIHDLPLLEMIKYPNVVNPDRRLRNIALKREWPIHNFR